MATHDSFDRLVAGLAAGQHGVFGRDQVVGFGASKGAIYHRLRSGRWEKVAQDVFRVRGSAPSWLQSLIVATLAWGEGSAISHLAAAPLWHLATFEPGPVELTVPRGRRRAGPGIVHRNQLLPRDVTALHGIPVTTPARTLIDLASVAPVERVEEALDDALNREIVSIARLRRLLAERGHRPGAGVLRGLLDARDPSASVPQSVFETRLLRTLLREGLPEPVSQYPVRSGGRVVAVPDFAYPDVRLAVEADGYRWHSGRTRWERDLARRNALTLLGWRIIHVTWRDLTHEPEAVVEAIRRALA